jgi:hypothetical protein
VSNPLIIIDIVGYDFFFFCLALCYQQHRTPRWGRRERKGALAPFSCLSNSARSLLSSVHSLAPSSEPDLNMRAWELTLPLTPSTEHRNEPIITLFNRCQEKCSYLLHASATLPANPALCPERRKEAAGNGQEKLILSSPRLNRLRVRSHLFNGTME